VGRDAGVAEFPSYVGALGMKMWVEDGVTHGRAEVLPEMFAPGTDRIRVGVLATMVDMVAGSPPPGAINPTVDLGVSLLARAPSSGTIHFVCRPAKVGRRLFVGETLMDAGDPDRPFARSLCTFMNELIPDAQMHAMRPTVYLGAPSFDDALHPRFVDDSTVEMDAHPSVCNGPSGTIQGGAQSLLAEIAAERALAACGDGEYRVVDLDIRFLNRVRTGPVAATAEILSTDVGPDFDDGRRVRVPIVELGHDSRIVSLVLLRCLPI
jgi:acyl-coenzyme A thioesterase PaaI-like protein